MHVIFAVYVNSFDWMCGRSKIVLPVPEVDNEVVEDDRTDVLADLHQDEPVAEPELLRD